MNKKLQTFKYIIGDAVAAVMAWAWLFLYRKIGIEHAQGNIAHLILNDFNFYLGLFFVPVFWLTLYALQGTYRDVYHKSRLKELAQTVFITIFGNVIIFFILLLDDNVNTSREYYMSVSVLFALHFCFTYAFRLVLTTRTIKRIHSGRIRFNTLLIGSKENALKICKDIGIQETSSGMYFVGYITVNGSTSEELALQLSCLGEYKQLKKIIQEQNIEEVVIALEDYEHGKISQIITQLERTNVIIKVTPGIGDILLGSVKMTSIFHTPLILVNLDIMPAWQKIIKRLMDIGLSILAVIILSPVFLVTAIGVKLSSKGPVFYKQERIGFEGKPFKMYKFRSMYTDAEKGGVPLLSHENDPRITPFGRFMRKVRLDEIPQFFNVLKGTMSLVGPRPERQYFVDQIMEKVPEYKLLQTVKPGITSWGQVKYGYAENLEEMLERLQYDLLYIENRTLATDIKILLYTIIIIVQGRGK